MRLALERCTIRSWKRQDEESLVRHANNRNVWINLRDHFPHPYRRSDGRRWLVRAVAARPETSWAIVVDGEAVGGIGFTIQKDVHHRSAEIGYWLGEPFWGRGIATEALRAVTRLAFAEHDLCRLYATVFAWNPASSRVLEKAGYRLEGRLRSSVTKDGRTIDQLLYAIVRDDDPAARVEVPDAGPRDEHEPRAARRTAGERSSRKASPPPGRRAPRR